MNPPAPAPALEREYPPFDELTLVKLCEWKIRGHYGLTEEQVQALIEDPVFEIPLYFDGLSTRVYIPPEHQVDPRIIKALVTREKVPTYYPKHWRHRFESSIKSYLPQERFNSNKLGVPLVDAQYRRFYASWKLRSERSWNNLAEYITERTVRDRTTPSKATRLQWDIGYLHSYYSFDDLLLREGHFKGVLSRSSLPESSKTISWHAGKSASEIYSTAQAIYRNGERSLPIPISKADFNDLDSEARNQVFRNLRRYIDCLNLRRRSWYYTAVLFGSTGPSLEYGEIAGQGFVVAIICKFHVCETHAYNNFPTIDELRQELRDQYARDYNPDYLSNPNHQAVHEPSWGGGEDIDVPRIFSEYEIKQNYETYLRLRPLLRPPVHVRDSPSLGSTSTDSLFREEEDDFSLN